MNLRALRSIKQMALASAAPMALLFAATAAVGTVSGPAFAAPLGQAALPTSAATNSTRAAGISVLQPGASALLHPPTVAVTVQVYDVTLNANSQTAKPVPRLENSFTVKEGNHEVKPNNVRMVDQ